MSSSPSNDATGLTNELAKERSRAALERTMTAWIQNCLILIGVGVTVDQAYNAVYRTFPDADSIITQRLAMVLGLGFIAVGLILLLLVTIEYPMQLKAIERNTNLRDSTNVSTAIIITVILIFGLTALLVVLLRAIV